MNDLGSSTKARIDRPMTIGSEVVAPPELSLFEVDQARACVFPSLESPRDPVRAGQPQIFSATTTCIGEWVGRTSTNLRPDAEKSSAY